ncbi:MAG TPA: dephospho-CoA kinase [Fibrobacteres bacterium]|jgi:dephospho-CoA kinase|nr:dephospho-CoA kinase [Fibrobacterota bacterium]
MSRILIGVTGNVASGKSVVARHFQEKGCALVDADKVAHELYATNTGLLRQLASEFGSEIMNPDGTLNRKRLGHEVFGDAEALMALDRIVHPHLLVALRERIFTARRVMNRAVLDAALIVEWGARREMDCLVLVTAPEEVRLRRLMERDGLSMDEASRRIRSQIPEDDKRPFADFEITNTGTPEQLLEKADAVWQAIEAKFAE